MNRISKKTFEVTVGNWPLLRGGLFFACVLASMGVGCVGFNHLDDAGTSSGSSTTTSSSSSSGGGGGGGGGVTPAVAFSVPSADGVKAVLSNHSSFSISGTCATGGGDVTISDSGSSLTPVTAICSSGAWSTSVNLSSLGDGNITLVASQTSNSQTATATRVVNHLAAFCVAHAGDADLIQSGNGNGTAVGTPYLICNTAMLNDVRNRTAGTKYFKLMNHIDVGGSFTSIAGFADNFDGNGLSISNATFTAAGTVGMFSSISTAGTNIHDLTLSSCSITAAAANGVGLLIGTISYTSAVINNVTITSGSISFGTARQYIGGMIGLVNGTGSAGSVAITNSSVNVTVNTSSSSVVGGLVGLYADGVSATDVAVTGSVSGGWSTGDFSVGGAFGEVGGSSTGALLRVSFNGTVTASNIDGVGGLLGRCTGTCTVSYCSSQGTVNGGTLANNYIGGLMGEAPSTTIDHSYSTATVNAQSMAWAGGLVGGGTSVSISTSYATGAVTNSVGYAAGFAGQVTGTISQSYSTGNVTVSATGGAAGFIMDTTGSISITDCYAWGNVSSSPDAAYGFAAPSGAGFTFTRVYSKGSVTTAGSNKGGFSPFGTVTNSFWNTTTSGQAGSGGASATGLSDAQSQVLTNYTGFSASGNWKIDTAISVYPILNWQ
jgi:hypothetical protein